jgi:AGZA family xanthine/uracil permease-like MFS transporter
MDLGQAFSLSMISIIFTLWFVDFFDTAGTLVGLADRAGFTDSSGNLPRGSKAFLCDGIATTVGAIVGTSNTTTYIESMSGIEDGAKTGFSALVVGLLFIVSLFFWPLAGSVPSAATAPALVIVGAMMMTSAARVNWSQPTESIPAFLTMITMPFTYSIANGIAVGLVSYTALNLLAMKRQKLNGFLLVLSAILIIKYVGFLQ